MQTLAIDLSKLVGDDVVGKRRVEAQTQAEEEQNF